MSAAAAEVRLGLDPLLPQHCRHFGETLSALETHDGGSVTKSGAAGEHWGHRACTAPPNASCTTAFPCQNRPAPRGDRAAQEPPPTKDGALLEAADGAASADFSFRDLGGGVRVRNADLGRTRGSPPDGCARRGCSHKAALPPSSCGGGGSGGNDDDLERSRLAKNTGNERKDGGQEGRRGRRRHHRRPHRQRAEGGGYVQAHGQRQAGRGVVPAHGGARGARAAAVVRGPSGLPRPVLAGTCGDLRLGAPELLYSGFLLLQFLSGRNAGAGGGAGRVVRGLQRRGWFGFGRTSRHPVSTERHHQRRWREARRRWRGWRIP